MLPLTRSRNRARFFGIPFSPSTLFAGGTVAGAWYDPSDLSTMFTTDAGTTPVAMPGLGAPVPVGLMLDKSQGLVLGPQTELVTNGTFNTDIAGWTFTGTGGSAAWNAGTARITGTSSVTKQFSQGISVVAGKSYTITGTVTPVSGTLSASLTLRTTNDVATSAFIAGQGFSASGGTINFKYVAPTTTTVFVCIQSFATISTFDIDNISIVEWIQGNHAISFNNTTARPELRARVNLLTYSEEFDNGAWDRARLTISANTPDTTDPLGGNTADKGTETTDNGTHRIYQIVTTTANATFTGSIYFKKGTRQWVWTSITVRKSADATFINQYFDLDNISLGQQTTAQIGGTVVATFVSANIIDAGNGWRKATIVCTTQNTPTSVEFYAGLASADGTNSYAGSTSEYGYIWGADLRPANIGANVPAYQRIADANTYDTSGFPLYLFFTTDDSMYTPANLNLSGTDKVAVFAGVRKLSDAAAGFVAEFSVNSSSNDGAFLLAAPRTSAEASYGFRTKGTGLATYAGTTYAAPITNVTSCVHDIAGATIAQEIIPRVNGATPTLTATDAGPAGTGNFGTYPLYIGSRANSGVWLNGHLYSLAMVGSAVSAGNIDAMESWVAGKTGIAI